MSNLLDLNMVEALDGLKAKKFSAVELTKAYIKAMADTKALNAYITETPELALKQAANADANYAKGQARALEGMPLGIKDMYCTKGVQTTAASKMLKGFVPTYESTVTQKLWDAGGVLLGKLNQDEFAMGASGQTSFYGPTVNPWRARGSDKNLIPGGSSSGSAAAVAARSCIAATGTDTGGSNRHPASYSGVVGMKPTYGRCSRWGIIAFASSLDQAGPITRTVEDAALFMQVIGGHDPKDSTSVNKQVPNFNATIKNSIKGLRVGIPKECKIDGLPSETEKLWQQGAEWLKSAGAEIKEVSLPHMLHAVPTYYIIAPAEASSNLARYDGVRFGYRAANANNLIELYEKTRAEGFGKEVRRRIMIGTYVLSAGYYDAYYLKAQKVRSLILEDFKKAYESVDVILTPTTPGSAFPIGESINDPIKFYMEDIFTGSINMAGLPAISVPSLINAQGLPQGLQIVGRAFDEETMFRVAYVLEQAAGFKNQAQLMAKG